MTHKKTENKSEKDNKKSAQDLIDIFRQTTDPSTKKEENKEEKKREHLDLMRDIKININTGTLKWTEDFIKCDGKHLLLETLAFSNYFGSGDENKKKRDLQTETLLTIRGLANTSFGITEFKKDKEFLKFLVLFLDHPDRNAKDTVLFLLAQFCTLDEENFNGFELVLEAFNFYKIVKQEKHRFETFVRVLKDSKHPENKFNACCLLNGLITGSEKMKHIE